MRAGEYKVFIGISAITCIIVYVNAFREDFEEEEVNNFIPCMGVVLLLVCLVTMFSYIG